MTTPIESAGSADNRELNQSEHTRLKLPMQILKERTWPEHEKLDRNSPMSALMQSDLSAARYLDCLTLLYDAVEVAEGDLNRFAHSMNNSMPANWEQPKNRSPLLKEDIAELRQLISTDPAISRPSVNRQLLEPQTPLYQSEPAALGGMYVLEGSRHGGAMMGKKLKNQNLPARYFLADVKTLKSDWQNFGATVNARLCDKDELELAVQGALDTFALFSRSFSR